MTDDESQANSDRLSGEIQALRADLHTFIEAFETHKTANDRRTKRLTIVIGVILVLIAIGILVVNGNRANADRLEAVVQAAICPENAFLVGGYDPSTRAPGYAQESYEDAFKGMRYGRAILNCKENPVPKRIDK